MDLIQPPMPRKFLVRYAKQHRIPTEDGYKLTPLEEVIERDAVIWGDSFVVFGNGPEFSHKTDVIAIAWEPGMRVEEITDDGA